jgi:starch-binding outer membrane protein, SusD/RagB family
MIKNIIKLSIATLLFASCQKQVTDDIKPIDRLSSNLAFSSAQKMENSVLGSYNALQSANFLSGRALVYVDLMGEDIFDKGNFFGTLPRFDQLGNSGFAQGVWDAGYSSIATANRCLAGIAANPTVVSSAKAAELNGECFFVRAVSHFYLVNFFGQPYGFSAGASHPGIPIIKESFTSNSPAANKPRSTVAEVYTQIIADLNAAITNLPATYGTSATAVYSNKTRGTKAAAAAILARVYLYMNDYTNARKVSLDIINGLYGTFALRPTPNGAFGINNYQTSETIWSIPNNVNDNPNTNNALPMHYMPTGRGDLAVSTTFMNAATNPYFEADDLRRTTMLFNGTGSNATFFYTNKYPDVNSRGDWAPIARYAEVLLTYAEASAEIASGVDADAVTKLNLVRDRARVSAPQYTVASFANKAALLAAIRGERRIELAFEGHRFWDVMRIKGTITNKFDNDGTTVLPPQAFGANKNIFPIPQAEVDKSAKVLVQNIGY